MSWARIDQKKPCERCNLSVSTNEYSRQRHTVICDRIPLPAELRAIRKDENLTYKQLAKRYKVAKSFMMERCKIGYSKPPRRYTSSMSRITNCGNCGILLSADRGSGRLCGACYSGVSDRRPERSAYHSPEWR